MLPNIEILFHEITEKKYPSRTYKIDGLDNSADRINGYTDGLDAVKQAVYLILSSERYKHIIYSWDYGVELLDLYGRPMSYVICELPRRVKEALLQDNRIQDITDFEFERVGKKLHATFTVVSNAGNIPTEVEVEL